MTKIYFGLFVCALLLLSGCSRSAANPSSFAAPPDARSIVMIFQQGLDTNKEKNPDLPDAEAFGAALISIAWEQFANNPDAAPQMFSVFENFVKQSDVPARYYQWNIFLENLETALLKSRDAKHLSKNWKVRQLAIDSQTKALQEWIQVLCTELDKNAITLNDLKNLAEITAFEQQSDVEILLELFESEEVEEAVKAPLTQKINEIAQIINGKLLQLEQEIEAEQKNDLPGSNVQIAPEKESEQKGLVVYKKGKYQKLMDSLFSPTAFQDESAMSFWSTISNKEDSDKERTEKNFEERLSVAYQKVLRLQKIRYNLWAVRLLSSKSSMTNLSHIDAGLLEPSAGALYSQRENELITQQPDKRESEIREILLRKKVPLEAF